MKLWARVRCLVFLTHSVDLLLTLTLTRRFVIGRRTASKRTEMFTTSVHFARLRNYNTGATDSSDHPVGQVDVRKIHGGTSGQTSPSLGDLHRSHAVTDRYIQYTRSHQHQNTTHSPPPPSPLWLSRKTFKIHSKAVGRDDDAADFSTHFIRRRIRTFALLPGYLPPWIIG